MKRYTSIVLLFILLLSISPSAIWASGSTQQAGSSVYDTIQKGGSDQSPVASTDQSVAKDESPSLFSLLLKFVLSFGFVILLLVVLLKVLSKRTKHLQSNGPILPIAGYNLGNNRSVQVILVGQTIYVLGVGDSIQLLRSIPQGEEYQHLLDGYEQQADGISFLPKDVMKKWDTVFGKHLKNMEQENGEE